MTSRLEIAAGRWKGIIPLAVPTAKAVVAGFLFIPFLIIGMAAPCAVTTCLRYFAVAWNWSTGVHDFIRVPWLDKIEDRTMDIQDKLIKYFHWEVLR